MKFLMLLLMFLSVAYAGHSPDPVMGPKCRKSCAFKGKASNAPVNQEKAIIGDLVRCPVSGVLTRVKKESIAVTHKGKRYFVCCEGCAKLFKAHPEQYT